MVIKVFISGISASKEVKKHQLRAQFLLDSYKIKYELVDISDPLLEEQRDLMIKLAKRRSETVPPQPPQFFNDDEYCGDYEDLENANDNDELFEFLKLGEDMTIENGDDDENELFQPPTTNTATGGEQTATKGDNNNNNNNNDNSDNTNENNNNDEEIKTEVCEQVTINGVVYEIPPNRKINIGGRIIDVDELMKEEGEEVDIDKVDETLKNSLNTTTTSNNDDNDTKNDDQ